MVEATRSTSIENPADVAEYEKQSACPPLEAFIGLLYLE